MSASDQNANPPDVVNPDLEATLTEHAESEAKAVQTNTPSVKGEAEQFDRGQTLADAQAEHQLKEMYRQSVEESELHGLRKDYTRRLFMLTCIWLITVLTFVFFSGLNGIVIFPTVGNLWLRFSFNMAAECEWCVKLSFSLTEKVLIAFITSTTASVIGIFIIVAKWLFPTVQKPDHKKSDDEKS